MAKIATIGLPAHGHTNPTLPVVQELIQRGHEVLYYNAESFRAKVAPTGVDFRAYPEPMPTEREVSEAIRELIDASRMLARISEHLTPFMLAEIERERPDLIVYDTTAMWGYIAARTYHIPHICSITHFVLNGSQGAMGLGAIARFIWRAVPHLPALMGWKRRMKQRYGSRIVGGITEYADVNLVFTSKEFHPVNSFIDERFRFVGPSLNASTRVDARDGDFPFEQLSDGTRVYISLGTINNLDLAFYRAAFAAFADYPAQFILSVGKNTDIAQLGEIPSNFIVQTSVPQLEILQRVDAFITHGGMNSVHEGLVYGVPLVVVPQQIEQLLNGKRAAQTGVGVLLGDDYPYGQVTAAELRQALDTVLTNPAYRQRARQMGDTLRAAGGYLQAVAEIETFLAEKTRSHVERLEIQPVISLAS